MTKKDYQDLNNSRTRVISVNTFKRFWNKFHEINPQLKVNLTECLKLWDSCNCDGKRRNAIQNVKKTKVSALEYLKLNL